jgi:hypothetical protein
MPLAQRAVNLGKETIRFMTTLNNTSNLYRRNQVFYHQFLTSAIAVLFLASTHAPLQFSSQCRTEFYMALELVKDMSARSWVSQRLWRTVRSLKAYAPRLGLGEDDQRSGAAMTMAGLASGSIRGMPASAGPQSPLPTLPIPISRTSSSGLGVGRSAASNQFSGTNMPQPQSPAAIASSQQQQQQQGQGVAAVVGEDQDNGQRLGTEMKALFEGYMGLSDRHRTVPMPLAHNRHASDSLTPGSVNVVSPETGVDGAEGVFPIVRGLF